MESAVIAGLITISLIVGIVALQILLLRWLLQTQRRLDEMKKQTAILIQIQIDGATTAAQQKLLIQRMDGYATANRFAKTDVFSRPDVNSVVSRSAESNRE